MKVVNCTKCSEKYGIDLNKSEEWYCPYCDNLYSFSADKLSVDELQAIRIKELKDFSMKILQAELKNQELQKELDSCIQTLIEASAAATIMQDIVVGNLVDRKLADLAKTHKLAVDYIEKVTGKNIDVVLAENAVLEALEGEEND